MEYTKYKFRDICIKKGFVRGPFGSALKKSLFVPKGEDTYKVYEQCVPLEQNKYGGHYYITGDYFRNSLSRFEVRHNDFLVSCSGVNYGAIYHLQEPFEKGVINQALLIIRIDDTIVDYNYFKYLFRVVLSKAITTGTGDSTIPNFPSMEVIKDVDVYLPPLETQKKVGEMLNTIENRIQANNRVNDNLQQQLKLMYDYWFTQFDFPDENGKPYRSSGGQMIWNDRLKRDIPAGWQVKPLSQIMKKNISPFDYSSKQPAIDLSVMPSDTIALSEINTSDNFTTNLFEMKKGDILFGSIRPYLHKAGFAPCDGVVAGTVHSYRTIDKRDSNFALLTIACDTFFDYAVNVSSGTKMPVVSSDSILAYNVPYNSEVVKRFGEISIVETIANNIQETQRLIALRDWLLPMLMNGQATISD